MQVNSQQIIAMITGNKCAPQHTGKENGIKVILLRNAEALNKILKPMFIEYRANSFKIAGKRPVVIKAKIEQLIAEGKMNKGSIQQLDNAVVFEPRNSYVKNYNLKNTL